MPCPPGQGSSNPGGQGPSSCLTCFLGYFSLGGQACQRCPAGTFGTSYGAVSADSCMPCEANFYSLEGSISCTPCASGTFSAAGASRCAPPVSTSTASATATQMASASTTTTALAFASPTLTTASATSTFSAANRVPDPNLPTPLPLAIVNVALTLSGIDLSLFSVANQASTFSSLVSAVAAAVGAAPSAVAIRRVSDVSNPAAPVVLYTNLLYAADSFLSRRLQMQQQHRHLSGVGAVQVDSQILLASNGAAAALSASLGPTALAASVASFLWTQGSPLAGAQVSVSVQPYTSSAAVGDAPGSPVLAIGAAAGAVTVLMLAAGFLYYRFKHRRGASVAPAADTEVNSAKSPPPAAAAAQAAARGCHAAPAHGH